ncbi:MAG: BON domain-containing protein [Gemmatimonadaceae bacterium]
MSSDRTNAFQLLAGIGIGAAIMYFLDPDRGNRRRHLAGDQARKALRHRRRELHEAVENARNHAVGAMAEARGRLSREAVHDAQLVERVRSELGRHVEHPRAIDVFVENGNVTLTGAVAPSEIAEAENAACSVRGVQCVTNRLVAREADTGVSD